jgi:hypothetical protein
MRVLVAIESCFQDRFKHRAQRDTWMKDIRLVEKRFFMGDVVDSFLPDEISLLGAGIPDSYETLSLKTRAICQWAVEQDFDFIFKADTDTVINPRGLAASGFQKYDYSGGFNEDAMPPSLQDRFGGGAIQFASGGAGFWLSRKALTLVANSDKVVSCAEDVFVAAVLREHGIQPTFNSGYRWRPGETVDKDLITLHLSSALQKKYEPSMMYEYYEKIKRAA